MQNTMGDLDIWPACLYTLMSYLIDLMEFLAFSLPSKKKKKGGKTGSDIVLVLKQALIPCEASSGTGAMQCCGLIGHLIRY